MGGSLHCAKTKEFRVISAQMNSWILASGFLKPGQGPFLRRQIGLDVMVDRCGALADDKASWP